MHSFGSLTEKTWQPLDSNVLSLQDDSAVAIINFLQDGDDAEVNCLDLNDARTGQGVMLSILSPVSGQKI